MNLRDIGSEEEGRGTEEVNDYLSGCSLHTAMQRFEDEVQTAPGPQAQRTVRSKGTNKASQTARRKDHVTLNHTDRWGNEYISLAHLH